MSESQGNISEHTMSATPCLKFKSLSQIFFRMTLQTKLRMRNCVQWAMKQFEFPQSPTLLQPLHWHWWFVLLAKFHHLMKDRHTDNHHHDISKASTCLINLNLHRVQLFCSHWQGLRHNDSCYWWDLTTSQALNMQLIIIIIIFKKLTYDPPVGIPYKHEHHHHFSNCFH